MFLWTLDVGKTLTCVCYCRHRHLHDWNWIKCWVHRGRKWTSSHIPPNSVSSRTLKPSRNPINSWTTIHRHNHRRIDGEKIVSNASQWISGLENLWVHSYPQRTPKIESEKKTKSEAVSITNEHRFSGILGGLRSQLRCLRASVCVFVSAF